MVPHYPQEPQDQRDPASSILVDRFIVSLIIKAMITKPAIQTARLSFLAKRLGVLLYFSRARVGASASVS